MTCDIVKSFSKDVSRISCTILITLVLCWSFLLPSMVQNVEASAGIGYWIVVEGAYFHEEQYAVNYGCFQVYTDLLGVGYTVDRIRYVTAATKETFTQAVQWAGSKVTSNEPLWIYMFDHGNVDSFSFRGGTSITYAEVKDLLNANIASNARATVIIAACHSGSAIDDLSSTQRMTITSCASDQLSAFCLEYEVPNWEAFSKPFWDKIREYATVKDSFNYACNHVKNVQNITDQDPQLDDNGDGVGHTSPLPNGSDGNIASNLHIGSHAFTSTVGGVQIPVDKLGLLAPYVGFASTILVATVAAALYVNRVKHKKEKQ